MTARPLFDATTEPGAPASAGAPPAVPEYPPIQDPPGQQPGEPRAHYAGRLFAWLMTEHGNTATMTDADLELAAYGARIATDARDRLPAYYDRIADAERILAGAIRRRRALAAELETAPPAPGPDDRPNAGPMARLEPGPDVNPTPPTTYAPAPGVPAHLKPGARIQF